MTKLKKYKRYTNEGEEMGAALNMLALEK